MNRAEFLDKFLRSFESYYDIKRMDVTAPFAAEAEFHTHDEQYFLIKSATISEAESNEYVYFASTEKLDKESFQELDRAAWETGLSRIRPHKNHRNSDITLYILADHITEEVFSLIPKQRHYKSYCFSLQGWTNYRLVAIELTSGRSAYNRQGRDLKKLVCNILNHS